jgi:hypothetical protein
MVRPLRAAFVIGGILGSLGGVPGWMSANRIQAAEGPPCTIATKGSSPVAKACADGGITKAKVAMKELAKKARAAGTKYQCDDCHKDDVKYELTDDARDKFKKLLAAAEGSSGR